MKRKVYVVLRQMQRLAYITHPLPVGVYATKAAADAKADVINQVARQTAWVIQTNYEE
jgi:predicted site-specific integrase-resolvase